MKKTTFRQLWIGGIRRSFYTAIRGIKVFTTTFCDIRTSDTTLHLSLISSIRRFNTIFCLLSISSTVAYDIH